MNIKKRHIYTIIGLLILVIGIFTIYATVDKEEAWHDFYDILVTVDGFTMTLQEAISGDVFRQGATSSGVRVLPNPGHTANEIWVSIDGDEKTLEDAISTSTSNGLCGSSTTSYSSAPSTLTYQFANDIEVSSGISLQDAIDGGDFCCDSTYGQDCPSGNLLCINAGTTLCDGACTGSYKPAGTSCGTNKKCDGSGNCVTVCTYSWYTGGWTECSPCLNGVHSREVYCRCDGTRVADSYCPSPKPASSEYCYCYWATYKLQCGCNHPNCNPDLFNIALRCYNKGETYRCCYYYCQGRRSYLYEVRCRG